MGSGARALAAQRNKSKKCDAESRRGRRVSLLLAFLQLMALLVTTDAGAPTQAAPGKKPQKCVGVPIRPGMRIQAKINAHHGRTRFCIKEGIYRLSKPLVPKSGNTLVGVDDPSTAVRPTISGAKVVRSWVGPIDTSNGPIWYAPGQTQQSAPAHVDKCGWTFAGSPAEQCGLNEWVYFDDKPLTRESDISDLGPGEFYFDYLLDRIYVGSNPKGRKVEGSLARGLIDGSKGQRNVTLRGLVLEKAANAVQQLAAVQMHGSRNVLDKVVVRLNHGLGVNMFAGSGSKVVNSKILDNGQLGLSGGNDRMLIQNNEIARNNFAGFYAGWEAGGAKWIGTRRLVVRNNYVHHNNGYGLWTDGICSYEQCDHLRNHDLLLEGNRVEANGAGGILEELDRNATFRGNIVRNNGTIYAWGQRAAGIVIKNSWGFDWSDGGSILILANSLGGNAVSSATRYGIALENDDPGIDMRFIRVEKNALNSDILVGCDREGVSCSSNS